DAVAQEHVQHFTMINRGRVDVRQGTVLDHVGDNGVEFVRKCFDFSRTRSRYWTQAMFRIVLYDAQFVVDQLDSVTQCSGDRTSRWYGASVELLVETFEWNHDTRNSLASCGICTALQGVQGTGDVVRQWRWIGQAVL